VVPVPAPAGIVTVRPTEAIVSRQRLGQFVGISGANSGARGLSMNRVVIPPGASAAAHRHVGSESVIYLIQGTVRTRYGPRLEHAVVNRPWDFLFIPPGVPHQAHQPQRHRERWTSPAHKKLLGRDPLRLRGIERGGTGEWPC
jgi:uncharacterized RmlC-like cupin family protein